MVPALASLLVACGAAREDRAPEPLLVAAAASLARPLGAALDVHARTSGERARLVTGGSVDLARRVADLGESPAVIALADERVMQGLQRSGHVGPYLRFARNRLVLGCANRPDIGVTGSAGWMDVLLRPGVEVARADPSRAPAGYRTLIAWRLAERRLARPGLAGRLAAASPQRDVRADESEALALVSTGATDCAWAYESSARAAGLRVLALPAWMDFGDPAMAGWYASDSVRIAGRSPGDSVWIRGAPIYYVFATTTNSRQAAASSALLAFLASQAALDAMRAAGLTTIEPPERVDVPPR